MITLTALGDRLDAGVLVVERGDEHDGVAELVLLEVDRALEEDLRLASVESVADQACAVLRDHAAGEGAVDDIEHLSCTRVRMRSVHATGAEPAQGHGQACIRTYLESVGGETARQIITLTVVDESREVASSSTDSATTSTLRRRAVEEIENELRSGVTFERL